MIRAFRNDFSLTTPASDAHGPTGLRRFGSQVPGVPTPCGSPQTALTGLSSARTQGVTPVAIASALTCTASSRHIRRHTRRSMASSNWSSTVSTFRATRGIRIWAANVSRYRRLRSPASVCRRLRPVAKTSSGREPLSSGDFDIRYYSLLLATVQAPVWAIITVAVATGGGWSASSNGGWCPRELCSRTRQVAAGACFCAAALCDAFPLDNCSGSHYDQVMYWTLLRRRRSALGPRGISARHLSSARDSERGCSLSLSI
jgi:hypothetical protein